MSNPTWSEVMRFNLEPNPIIFDVGGYRGDFVNIVINRYENPTVYVFEPVKEFYDIIVDRYKDNSNVKVFNFGLSDKDRIEYISNAADSSSTFRGDGVTEIKLKGICEFLFEEQIFNVDLIKINIEGEEYRLLNHLVKTPELIIFNNLLIQFHNFIDGCIEKRQEILNESLKYYDRLFNYDFIFEGWSLKKIKHIKCLGDSHISIFSNSETLVLENRYHSYENFSTYRFGPYLAYTLNTKNNVSQIISKLSKDEHLLLSFGEIDCRAQVKKICDETNRPYTVVIDEILGNYFRFINTLNMKNLLLLSVAPELKESPFEFYYNQNPQVFDKPRGTYAERREYKEYFNNGLEMFCKQNGYKFINLYQYLINEFDTKSIYFLDDIHLKPNRVKYLIKKELIKSELTL